MLNKMSCTRPTSRVGVLKVRSFELYSKKTYQSLIFFGFTKGSVCQANRHRKYLLGYKLKGYVVQTKKTGLRGDATSMVFFKNKVCLKHRKIQKYRKNYGPVQKVISKKKFLFKYGLVV